MRRTRIAALAAILAPAAALAQPAPGVAAPPPDAGAYGVAPIGRDGYRTGLPEVLAAAPRPGAAVASASPGRFRAAYQARKSPRLAVFWNRELTDEIDARRFNVERERTAAAGIATGETRTGGSFSQTVQPYGYGSLAQGISQGGRSSSLGAATLSDRERVTFEGQAGSGARPTLMTEAEAWRFEQAFSEALQGAGARLVDRSTVIRLAAAGEGKGGGKTADNIQRAEFSGLKGHAEIVVEVLAARDETLAPLYRATAKEIATGLILADVTVNAADVRADEAVEWKATERGFEANRAAVAPTARGRALAVALMDRLADHWGGRK